MPVEFGFRMCSFWSNHNITKFLYSAEIPDASILAGIYIILLFFSSLIWCALIFHVYCYGRNVKLLLNYCLSAQEPRIFLPLCIISNAGGFPQYFKMVIHLLDPTVGTQGPQLYQTEGSIHTAKICLYWLSSPKAARSYKTLGRVGEQSKITGGTKCPDPVSSENWVCVWIQHRCRK